MFQLAYISFKSPEYDIDGENGIDSILEVANKFNKENKISGLLIYRRGVFIQLIEGEKEIVLNLYGRIASDLRHESQRILLKQEVDERLFSDWSMQYREINNIEIDRIFDCISWEEIVDKTRKREIIKSQKIKELFIGFKYNKV